MFSFVDERIADVLEGETRYPTVRFLRSANMRKTGTPVGRTFFLEFFFVDSSEGELHVES